jgi:hypothetical protein
MKYSFNVCCDSSNNYYSQINGSTTSFFFDWGLIPDGKYDLTFSYMSDDTTTTLSPVMTLWVDFNSAGNSYLANAGQSKKINFLGNLKADKHGANAFYYADTQLNPPVQLIKPTNNVFTVSLNNALTTTAYSTPVAAPYVLVLHFESCEDKY